MGEAAGALFVFAFLFWIVFAFLNVTRSVGRTTRAIGSWNDRQLRYKVKPTKRREKPDGTYRYKRDE